MNKLSKCSMLIAGVLSTACAQESQPDGEALAEAVVAVDRYEGRSLEQLAETPGLRDEDPVIGFRFSADAVDQVLSAGSSQVSFFPAIGADGSFVVAIGTSRPLALGEPIESPLQVRTGPTTSALEADLVAQEAADEPAEVADHLIGPTTAMQMAAQWRGLADATDASMVFAPGSRLIPRISYPQQVVERILAPAEVAGSSLGAYLARGDDGHLTFVLAALDEDGIVRAPYEAPVTTNTGAGTAKSVAEETFVLADMGECTCCYYPPGKCPAEEEAEEEEDP